MRILHLMLSCFYIDNANYQENVIPRLNKKNGHEVKIIASTEIFVGNKNLGYALPGSYMNEDGIPVTRLPYIHVLNKSISKKVRAYPGLYKMIDDFSPDIILFHGAAAYALILVTQYKRNNPNVKLYVDSHEDFHNSAKGFLSRNILHKYFYKHIIQKCLPYIDKVLYITYDTFVFLKNAYNIPDKDLFFFPLGGIIPEKENREKFRQKIRSELKINDDQILIIHSGKLDVKKRTPEIIEAFASVPDKNMRLIIIGSMDEEVAALITPVIEADPRISFLGWMTPDALQNYLCAGDLYVQLGGQSVSMQHALCCGCTAALYPFESHKFLLKDSVFYIENKNDLINVLESISSDRNILEMKRKASSEVALSVLNYENISAFIYNNSIK